MVGKRLGEGDRGGVSDCCPTADQYCGRCKFGKHVKKCGVSPEALMVSAETSISKYKYIIIQTKGQIPGRSIHENYPHQSKQHHSFELRRLKGA